MKRKVAIITGARSEYDLLVTVLQELERRDDVELTVVAGASHHSPFHGRPVEHIRRDGFRVVDVESLLASDTHRGRSLSYAQLHSGLTYALSDLAPDLTVVTGDREEALAGALVANFLRIPVAHIHGGDRCVASDVDEVFRPAISKLAHLHFTATQGHRERLIRMGELPGHVWAFGAPGLDRLADEPDVGPEELEREFGLQPDTPFFLVIHHPVAWLSPQEGAAEMRAVLEGLLELGHRVFCGYPNTDQGNVPLREVIDELAQGSTLLHPHFHLSRGHFVALYRRCAAIVGNSSSIVLESSFLKVGGILVGDRQNFREISTNVQRVSPVTADVTAAARAVLEDPATGARIAGASSIYGDGTAGPRIAATLATVPLADSLLLKTMPY
jgi:GDP/UDP-N,N'-diacetylbacillosamine 2-epimerase (hydrolysing)